MTRLNIPASQTVTGISGTLSQSGLTSPTFSQIGTPNADVTLSSSGSYVLASNQSGDTEALQVRAAADGYAIESPVTIVLGGEQMGVGINLAGQFTYAASFPFSNLCYHMSRWGRFVGSGSYTTTQGSIAATVGTDEFRSLFSDSGTGLPTGTYTVYNPDGCTIGIGTTSTTQNLAAYQTNTSFTFTYSGGTALYIFCKGSLTRNNGNLAVIMPGQTATWLAGNPWNSQFLTFMTGISPRIVRFMDFNQTPYTIETDWSDRADPNAISFRRSFDDGGAQTVPYEYQFDLCNRLGADPWICVPVRATQSHVESLAALAASSLNSNRIVYLELHNEIWNDAAAFHDGSSWCTYLDFTKKTAVANPTPVNTFTLAGHGLSNGDPVVSFDSKENHAAGISSADSTMNYTMERGETTYARVIDANTFALCYDGSLASDLTVYAGQVNLLFVDTTEVGKTAAQNTNYSNLCIRNWNAFDAALGASRVKHIIASQHISTSMTAARFAVSGVSGRADYVSTAHYFKGLFWGGKIDTTSGQFAPSTWVNSSCTVHIGVYSSGSTPTAAQVIAGTGTGFLNHQSVAATAGSSWVAASAVTGLSNGTNYEVYFVAVESTGYTWTIKKTVQASASATTTYFTDSNANQALRCKLSILSSVYDHATVAGVPHIGYEGGFESYDTPPTGISTIETDFQETAEFAGVLKAYLRHRASLGSKALCYFADVSSGVFSIADDYSDTSDNRYTTMASLAGGARVVTTISQANITATAITSDPGSYPYNVTTLPNSNWSYTIIGGNDNAGFQLSGNVLQLTSSGAFSWAYASGYAVTIFATDGYSMCTFVVNVDIGAVGASAIIARMSVTPDATRQGHITTLYNSLNSAGIIAKLDALYIIAAHDAQAARLNWLKNNFNLTAVSSPTFTTDRGYAGNGTTSYMETDFNPSTGGAHNFVQDGASIGIWSRSNVNNSGQFDIGCGTSTGAGLNSRSSLANTMRGSITTTGASSNYGSNTTSVGHFALVRTSSSLTTGYIDGSSVGTASTASTGVPSATINLMRAGGANYSTRQLAAAYIGGGLTSTDMSNLDSALRTYLTAIGAA